MAQVLHLFRSPKRGLPMEELFVAEAAEGVGFAGCAHARAGSQRQLLLVDRETLDALELLPGIIRENITTQGLNVNGLAAGESLCIGDVLLEVAIPCTPCSRLMDKIRDGLRSEIRGRRGMLCRVMHGGTIQPGDRIDRISSTG